MVPLSAGLLQDASLFILPEQGCVQAQRVWRCPGRSSVCAVSPQHAGTASGNLPCWRNRAEPGPCSGSQHPTRRAGEPLGPRCRCSPWAPDELCNLSPSTPPAPNLFPRLGINGVGETVAARGEGLGAAVCHLPVTAMALLGGRLWRRRFISRRERGWSWPWPCLVNQLPVMASISKEKSLPNPRGSGEFTDRPESHPGAQLRGGRGEHGEIFCEAFYPARSGHGR